MRGMRNRVWCAEAALSIGRITQSIRRTHTFPVPQSMLCLSRSFALA